MGEIHLNSVLLSVFVNVYYLALSLFFISQYNHTVFNIHCGYFAFKVLSVLEQDLEKYQ